MALSDADKAKLKRYNDKCVRYQILLNPENPDDAKIITYLNANDDGRPAATRLKALLLKHISMAEALKNAIGNI